MALFVLNAAGSDRPGLTEALAAAILSAGGNWLESHLSRLGGLYVGSVLVELEADGVEALRAAVSTVDAQGLEVRIAPAKRISDRTPDPKVCSVEFVDDNAITGDIPNAGWRVGRDLVKSVGSSDN